MKGLEFKMAMSNARESSPARSRYSLAVLAATLLSTNCATTGLKPWPPPQPSDAPVVFILFRSECEGVCPSYRISVRSDGLLEFEGLFNVAQMGRRWTQLTSDQVAALKALEFSDDRHGKSVASLTELGCAYGHPTISVVVTTSAEERAVCSSKAPATQLETTALKVLMAESWVRSTGAEP